MLLTFTERLTTALGAAGTVITQSVTTVTENDLCMVYVALGLICGGLGVFSKAKRKAK